MEGDTVKKLKIVGIKDLKLRTKQGKELEVLFRYKNSLLETTLVKTEKGDLALCTNDAYVIKSRDTFSSKMVFSKKEFEQLHFEVGKYMARKQVI